MYKVLSLDDFDQWSQMLEKVSFSKQDIYFTPAYYSLYQNYGDGEALCFVFEKDGETSLYPFLKNSARSAVFLAY